MSVLPIKQSMNNLFLKIIVIFIFLLLSPLVFADHAELLSFKYEPYLDGIGGGILEQSIIKILSEEHVELQITKCSLLGSMKHINKDNDKQIIFTRTLDLKEDYELIPIIELHKNYLFNSKLHTEWNSTKPEISGLKIVLLHNEITKKIDFPEAIFFRVESYDIAIKMLKNNRIDLFYTAEEIISFRNKKEKRVINSLSLAKWDESQHENIYIAIKNTNFALIKILKQGLNKMNE